MKKSLFLFAFFLTACSQTLLADHVDICWPMGDINNLSDSTVTAGSDAFVTPSFLLGSKISATGTKIAPDVSSGFTAINYEPTLVMLTPTTRVEQKTTGHQVSFRIKPTDGHTFKPTTIEFDAAKCGTDGGNFDVYIRNGAAAEKAIATAVSPARNRIDASNSTGKSHHVYQISDQLVDAGKTFQLILYIYNLNGQDVENPKSIGFNNVTISGETDEPIYDASHYFTSVSCSAGNLLASIASLKNGESTSWPTKIYGDPTDLAVTAAAGYTATISYANKYITVAALKNGKEVFSVSIRFTVSHLSPRGEAKPLNRGLLAVKTSAGILVSWRYRIADQTSKPRFRLYRNNRLVGSNPITERTNYLDTGGATTATYRLEVLDASGNIIETEETKPWSDQTKYITLQGGAPTDPTSANATYTPNDASFCDMDGDGEYEIILKWAPSNEKDAASNGTTSPAFYSCYKMDGTRLWMMHTGHNMFNSAHTTPFIAWDLDGDGYGEFMVKTAPGAVDGEGNYVLMDGDDPNVNLKSDRGKQDHGSEYISLFDGITGAELKTIKYHTAYADETTSFWGDSKQNRSERYLAAIAWLDGEDANPSAIFARGYYSGCKIGAYDWDGEELTMRWLHRGESAGKGTVTYANGKVTNLTKTVYGEGAHWISVGDVTGDGRQEIHYGSGALKPDGTTLYRTGFGHGDALHLSDFIPSRPGLEIFMAHEHKPYGVDLRDAATGTIIFRTEASGDTGRGLMAHFNPEAPDAYWQSSASADLFDTGQNIIASNISHGGGASLNNRIYWNGTLADDFYDKSVLEYWNTENSGFWRMQVNGTNYTAGNLNNYSKYNPCVLGDLLGDWREEIVNWTQSGTDFQLVINATDYETEYIVPHLMDNYAYRAQVINQNCAYNQPPHLNYCLIDAYTIERTVPQSGWDLIYAPYSILVPEGVTAYNVSGVNAVEDTVRASAIKGTAVIPAGTAVVYKANAGQTVRFRPTTMTASKITKTYLKGCSVDSVIVSNDDKYECYYTFRVDEKTGAVGFFKVKEPTTIPAYTPWLRVKGTSTNEPLEQYFWTKEGIPASVTSHPAVTSPNDIYDLSGRKIEEGSMKPGKIYIVNGEKQKR
ncbi:MAG: hypothetical protein K6F94_00525 [Bacteroidaceae bacterium]|nr:hypothetical protein [Bacteroidaceae bacterium]